MVLKAKNGCWKKGERCQTHKHPSSFISSGEDGVGESLRSKKIHRQERDTASFPLSRFFIRSLSLWAIWPSAACESLCGWTGRVYQRDSSLSLCECRCVFGWRCWVLCVYWSVVIERQSCWDSAQMEIVLAKGRKRWKNLRKEER